MPVTLNGPDGGEYSDERKAAVCRQVLPALLLFCLSCADPPDVPDVEPDPPGCVLTPLPAPATPTVTVRSTAELVAALNHVISGEIYLSPSISRHLVRNWLRDEESMAGVSRADTELSERERTVLKLIAEGRSNKEVASLLHISAKTVETHRARIMSKLELRTVPDLVRYAIKSGLVDL